jgi:hypothetical protein
MGRLRPGRTLYPLRQINESTKLAVSRSEVNRSHDAEAERVAVSVSSWVHVVFQKV